VQTEGTGSMQRGFECNVSNL